MTITINMERLIKDIQDLGNIGRDPAGGVSRPSFSKADLEARLWLMDRFSQAGLKVRQDGAGNIFGRKEGQGAVIMSGSHIDTVLDGGMFDGSIGVLAALECLRRIGEENIPHTKPLEAASFTDEEGNLVGDFLGSRSFLEPADRNLLEKGQTQFGVPFTDIIKNTDFTIDGILEAHKERPEIEAFLELHIEQGPVLETEEKSIGIVDKIAGKNYWKCFFLGRASHAGTTPFELRQDAFLGLADFALKSTHYVAAKHYGSMLTIGRMAAHPGSFSIVPGRVDFSLDFRSVSNHALEDIARQCLMLAEDIAATRGLQFEHAAVDATEPVPIPENIQGLLRDECTKLDYDFHVMPSGAGHDAQILAEVAQPGMIFIPCEDGISHSPDEKIKWEDLEKGANLLLRALIRLAQ
jgi:N-carbamoyl-L-amino-acid hydrolase